MAMHRGLHLSRHDFRKTSVVGRELGLRPLFIVRMAPKSYIEEVRQAGGFTLVFKYQLYPHGSEELAKRVKGELGLPADCPRAIGEGTVRRFLGWHLKEHGLGGA